MAAQRVHESAHKTASDGVEPPSAVPFESLVPPTPLTVAPSGTRWHWAPRRPDCALRAPTAALFCDAMIRLGGPTTSTTTMRDDGRSRGGAPRPQRRSVTFVGDSLMRYQCVVACRLGSSAAAPRAVGGVLDRLSDCASCADVLHTGLSHSCSCCTQRRPRSRAATPTPTARRSVCGGCAARRRGRTTRA